MTQQPINGIAATMFHDEGAIAQCQHCKRYTLDRKALADSRQPVCDCGKQHYWSGSFKPPGPDAQWFGPRPAAAPVEQAAPKFNTSKAGRAEVALFFAQHLKRHDFADYITNSLAADFACALAPALHALMAAQQAAQPVAGEPVAWRVEVDGLWLLARDREGLISAIETNDQPEPLYTAATAPVGLVPLTDRQLYTMARAAGVLIVTQREEDAAVKYGRAVLAAAGIKAGKDVAK